MGIRHAINEMLNEREKSSILCDTNYAMVSTRFTVAIRFFMPRVNLLVY